MSPRPIRFLAAAGSLLVLSSTDLHAQQAGLPVDHSPSHLPVTGFHLDFGQGTGYAGTGRIRSFGGRFQIAFDDAQLIVGAHRTSPGDDSGLEDGLGFQAALAWRILEARPRRVANVQAGLGFLRFEGEEGGRLTMLDVPLSLGFGAYLPTPIGPAEAWVAPRVHLRHVDISVTDGAGDGTRLGPGASAGLRFTLADAQAGFSVAIDGLALRDPADDDWQFLGAFQLALHLLLLRR